MTSGVKTIIYSVSDVPAAKERLDILLGTEPYSNEPYYVGYKVNGQDIGITPKRGDAPALGPVCFFEVGDIKTAVQDLTEKGMEIVEDVRDVGNGRLIATLKDADGNPLGVLQDPPA
ncbi:VOC family protein [Actinomadura rupiterrae]|uniref:VOC family protein n=1 Tax=Actinomadura rupiterrae TaxID=559627 RepID=UPI0020A2BCFD|nr:VOC family protein [Actinomadura rupiterrae]MCP2342854.1 putative enzyme related to lactoylglutathione lyase [Actinomadura rupiterrae]